MTSPALPASSGLRPLLPVALGTALVLVTYVNPIATTPQTAASLGAGSAGRAWMLSSMSVGLAAFLLASGVLGDAFGRRRVYLAGLVALAVGAVGCAVAVDVEVFVAARIVEGGGGAAVLSCGLAALAHHFPLGPGRVRATGIWGASVGVGIGLGVVVAALLDLVTGWRTAYVVTAVLALLLLVPSAGRIEDSRAETARRVDVPGLALLVVGMTLLVSALTVARNGLGAGVVVLAPGGLVGLAGFAAVETRVREPLLEAALLRQPRFLAATLGSLVLGLGMIGMASFVPTVAQVGLGTGLGVASLLVLCWAGTSVITSLLVRRLPWPLEGPRPIALLFVGVAVGQVLASRLAPDSSPWPIAVAMLVAGLSTGMLNALLGREAVASVPPDRAAMGSGANNTARYLGAACGITLFVTVATHTGADLAHGWNHAVLTAAALSLLGAGVIGTVGLRARGQG